MHFPDGRSKDEVRCYGKKSKIHKEDPSRPDSFWEGFWLVLYRSSRDPEHWSSAENLADCEYCGQDSKPLLQLSWERWPEEALAFCCVQRQQLYELLEEDRCVAGGRCLTSLAAEIGDGDQFHMDWDCALEAPPKEVILEDVLLRPALVTEGSPHALSFRLSRAPERCWTAYPRRVAEQHFGRKGDEQRPRPSLDRRPLKFGICGYQAGPDFAAKNYSSGRRLLAAFSDGSAQLFYPSGSLAIVVMVTEDNGRVCLVYDDRSAASESTRAIFHSDGRATCYHGNRSLWLNLNNSVGRCLEQDGTKVRQWNWSGIGRVPTAQDPLHLSLNERITVQILGREQVFLAFQACGEEVKLSVGRCFS